jgi:hypothetical protein
MFLFRPLFGLGEAVHWVLIFFRYHKEDLGLSPTSLDQCIFYMRDHNQLQALISLQVDDSLAVWETARFVLEEQKVTRFQHKTSPEASQKFSYRI